MFYTEFRENIKEEIYMERRVMIAAHRGTSGANIIQNTIGAYENALLHGADILELSLIHIWMCIRDRSDMPCVKECADMIAAAVEKYC